MKTTLYLLLFWLILDLITYIAINYTGEFLVFIVILFILCVIAELNYIKDN